MATYKRLDSSSFPVSYAKLTLAENKVVALPTAPLRSRTVAQARGAGTRWNPPRCFVTWLLAGPRPSSLPATAQLFGLACFPHSHARCCHTELATVQCALLLSADDWLAGRDPGRHLPHLSRLR